MTGLGLGLVQSPTNVDALSRAAEDKRTQVSGLIQTMRQLGGTIGIAVTGGGRPDPRDGRRDLGDGPRADRGGIRRLAAVLALAFVAGWFLLERARLQATDGAAAVG
ncbi:MAG: hypothetical protein WDN31_11350 [Hyphomicrobium sp.]